MFVDNISIEINNASGDRVYSIVAIIHSQSNVNITSTSISLTDIDVEWYISGIAYTIRDSANMFVDNISIEINNASGEGIYSCIYGVAYYIDSHSNITITSTNISLTDIDVNSSIYGIAYDIGSSGGYANILIDNTSIKINNVSG